MGNNLFALLLASLLLGNEILAIKHKDNKQFYKHPISPSKAKTTTNIAIYFSINKKQLKPVYLGLFTKIVPKTTKNFIDLCKGETPSGYSGKIMTYENSKVHRIIPKFVLQAGDFTKGDGTGGESIYGAEFADENFKVGFGKGVIAMANSGPDTNGSQFFITFRNTYWLYGRHVVFGRVKRGWKTLRKLEKTGSEDGEVKKNVRIVRCKVLN